MVHQSALPCHVTVLPLLITVGLMSVISGHKLVVSPQLDDFWYDEQWGVEIKLIIIIVILIVILKIYLNSSFL